MRTCRSTKKTNTPRASSKVWITSKPASHPLAARSKPMRPMARLFSRRMQRNGKAASRARANTPEPAIPVISNRPTIRKGVKSWQINAVAVDKKWRPAGSPMRSAVKVCKARSRGRPKGSLVGQNRNPKAATVSGERTQSRAVGSCEKTAPYSAALIVVQFFSNTSIHFNSTDQ
jgi:hypothetical protein